MLQFPQSLGLNLADAFARDRELLADFFQRVVGVHADAEAHAQDALFARRQTRQNPRRGFSQIRLDRRFDRQNGVSVFDEVAEVRIFFVANRRLKRDGLLGDFQNLAHFFERHGELFSQLFRRRLAADFVQHLAARAHDLVDRLDHVHGNADGSRLIRD